MKICVLAFDDHPIVRERIAAPIADETDIALVGDAADGREAVEQFRTLHPDAPWMDLQLPHLNGVQVPDAHTAANRGP